MLVRKYLVAPVLLAVLTTASHAAPIQIISTERNLDLIINDSWTRTQVGPFSDSTTDTAGFDSSLVGVLQRDDAPSVQATQIGEVSQTSYVSNQYISYSGLVSGSREPGLVTPEFYSGLETVSYDAGFGGMYGIVDGSSTLTVLFDVQSATDFLFDFTWGDWGNPGIGTVQFSLGNLETGDSIFSGWSGVFNDEWPDTENGSLAGTVGVGSYQLTAAIWSHWSEDHPEAPGGSLDFNLAFNQPIPEPTAALLFGIGFGVVGIAAKRKRIN